MTGLWRMARALVLVEIAIWRSLARWVARRPDVPGDATPLGYAQMIAPVLWLWIVASGTEVVVVELVLRSIDAGWAEVVRLPLLVIGAWGLLWMLGLLAAFRMRPHLLRADRLQIRQGPRAWVDVPYGAIASCRLAEHSAPNGLRAIHQQDDLLLAPVNGRTNIELRLVAPTTISTSSGAHVASRLALWVDDPRAATRLLDAQLVR